MKMKYDPEAHLEELVAHIEYRAQMNALMTAIINKSARALHEGAGEAPGMSWTEIGAALGITRQAARERFTRTMQHTSRDG